MTDQGGAGGTRKPRRFCHDVGMTVLGGAEGARSHGGADRLSWPIRNRQRR